MQRNNQAAQEEKKLAKLELTKICKAILIDQFCQKQKSFGSPLQGSQVTKVILLIKPSVSTFACGHIRMNTHFNVGTEERFNRDITGKQRRLLEKFLDKYGHNTKKVLKAKEEILLCLERQPTEEEQSWAKHIFEQEKITPEYGVKYVQFTFDAKVTLELNQHSSDTLESAKANLIDNIKNLVDKSIHCSITYKESPIEIGKTRVEDIGYQTVWWHATPAHWRQAVKV